MKNDLSKKIKRKSIVFTLTITIVLIFFAMIFIFEFAVNRYQKHLMDKMTDNLQFEIQDLQNNSENDREEKFYLIFEDISLRSNMEFRLYSILISIIITTFGVTIFYFAIINKIKPLKILADNVASIDIDNVQYAKNKLNIENCASEIYEVSEALNKSFEKLYKSYDKKRQFSINIAHEIKTPLAILRTKIDVFNKKKIKTKEDVDAFSKSMQNNIERLSKMVDGILMLSKDKILCIQKVDIKTLLDEIIFDLEDLAEKKDVKLNLQSDNMIIETDDNLLQRVLFNLIENAIKYNKKGGSVNIVVENMKDKLYIKIIDTGIGIADEQKEFIFDLFYTVDESRSRDTGGYGIGLALVKNILNRLNAKIHVLDNKPVGTIFELEFSKNLKYDNS